MGRIAGPVHQRRHRRPRVDVTGLLGGPSSSDIFDQATRPPYGQQAAPGLPHLRRASGTWGVINPLVPAPVSQDHRAAAYAWVIARNAA